VISALAEKYVDSYLSYKTSKELWDALDEKFGVSNAGSELYLMEQLYD
jgi:hypothetical protein